MKFQRTDATELLINSSTDVVIAEGGRRKQIDNSADMWGVEVKTGPFPWSGWAETGERLTHGGKRHVCIDRATHTQTPLRKMKNGRSRRK